MSSPRGEFPVPLGVGTPARASFYRDLASRQPTAQKEEGPMVRDSFTTRLGVIAATLGSAVGLGNIWKFPFLTGMNGGAAFILVYLLSTLVVGLPVMITELVMGRTAKADAIGTLRKLAPNKPWWLVGASGVLAAFLIMAFYTEVVGWILAYIFKAASGAILSTEPAVTTAAFEALITDPFKSLYLQWIVLAVVGVIIAAGVSRGIERTTKRLMPLLFAILVVVCIRSLTLPGAGEGLRFLTRPDFSKLTWPAVLIAMGLSFFKLSVGMGTMTTYGSYFGPDQDIPGTAVKVMLSDVLISLLCGIAIFPAVFAFGFQPDSGPGLLFITIPTVFSSMPLGQVLMPLFFILAAIAATGAMLSLYEVPVAYLEGTRGWSRRSASLVTFVLLALVGSTAALSSSVMADVKLFGMTPFDLFDFLTSNILLPVGGFFLTVFLGWVWGWPQVENGLSNNGSLNNEGLIKAFGIVVRFVTPVLVLLVLLNGLGVV
jgi:NSS family neurotransmitter:Na+ symporter